MKKQLQTKTTLSWKDGVPSSDIYGDIYFCKENGLAEANHVFLEGNNLPERWSNQQSDFHIIETGFGTGLNFFASWKLWRKKTHHAKLYYTSIEKHPLNLNDIKKAISLWSEFNEYIDEFSMHYPAKPQGQSILFLDNGNVQLNLLWRDVNDIISNLNIPADAWFLDGFSPAKNPDIWSNNLYKQMARITSPNGTFATFTAAGHVRRGLQLNGFNVKKIPGFAQKRHMLVGKLINNN